MKNFLISTARPVLVTSWNEER